eukprot:708381-Prymnesium_polylepis.1
MGSWKRGGGTWREAARRVTVLRRARPWAPKQTDRIMWSPVAHIRPGHMLAPCALAGPVGESLAPPGRATGRPCVCERRRMHA